MGYTIDENPLREKQDEVRKRAAAEEGPAAVLITDLTKDDGSVPEYIREYAAAISAAADQAAASPPEHEEYHVTDLVEIAIPYHFLLNLVYAVQTTANDIVDQVKATSVVISNLPKDMDIPSPLIDILNASANRYLDYIHLGSSLNSIRLAAKPLDLPDPHGERQEKEAEGFSAKDMEDLQRLLGGETFESDN
jgi:hypothetical protein